MNNKGKVPFLLFAMDRMGKNTALVTLTLGADNLPQGPDDYRALMAQAIPGIETPEQRKNYVFIGGINLEAFFTHGSNINALTAMMFGHLASTMALETAGLWINPEVIPLTGNPQVDLGNILEFNGRGMGEFSEERPAQLH